MACGPRILVVGGGYGGMHTALRLGWLLRPGEATVMIADPRSHMTYQPLLAEAAAGNLEPRHVVVPLRGVLRRTQVIKAAVSSVDHERRIAHLAAGDGAKTAVGYDMLVLAPGSVSRVLPIPGLAEAGIGFKTIDDAIHLRNHVLGKLDAAAAAASDDVRRASLTFVFVGGGYAGVEALAGLQDMAFDACAGYPELSHRHMRWILVEAADRILPEVSTAMARYTVALLRRRRVEVRLQTRLASAEGGRILLDDGEEFPAGTLVWTAGAAPSPLTSRLSGLPTDGGRRVIVDDFLAVHGVDGAGRWATARPSRTWPPARPPGKCARPPHSTPTGRPAAWPATSRPCCAGASRVPTGTPLPGRWPASGVTAASRRSTGCGCRASPPG
jgi:NADH dehydrogenase